MDTPDKLKEAIANAINNNIGFRNADYDEILELLWGVIFEANESLRRIVDKVKVDHLPEKEFTCLLILTNCMVDTHACHQVLKQGFHRAAAIVARGMLENLALSIAMKGDDSNEIFQQYKFGSYDIPKAIGPAKQHFEEIGKLYGILSNTFAHEPYDSIGRSFIQEGGTSILLLVPPVGRDNFLTQFVLATKIAMLVSILGHAIEWTFANSIAPEIYWIVEPGRTLKGRSGKTAEAIKKMGVLLSEKLNVENKAK